MHLRSLETREAWQVVSRNVRQSAQRPAPESCVPGMRILCSGRCHSAATSWPIQFAASRRVTSDTGGRWTATAAALQLASSALTRSPEAAAPSSHDASAQASGRVTPGFAASAAFASVGASRGALSTWTAGSSSASSALESEASPEAAAAGSEAAALPCSCSCCASALDVRRERLRRDTRGVTTCVTPRSAGSMCLEIPSSRARARFIAPSGARQRATGAGARLWRPITPEDKGSWASTGQGGRASADLTRTVPRACDGNQL